MQLNQAQRELTLKIVYYGPGLSGKTTNLQKLHERVKPELKSQLLNVETHDDRTLFFDLMPLVVKTQSGFKIRLKLFTVPGQVLHNATRKIVLQGADGIAFIADSRRNAKVENNNYWKNMTDNMKANGLNASNCPIVIQFNKRDLPDTLSDEELQAARKNGREPVIGAIALRGVGVLETLHSILQQSFRAIDAKTSLAKTTGVSESEFLSRIFAGIDISGTALERAVNASRGVA